MSLIPPDEATEEDVLRDERALAMIVLSVSDGQMVHVAGKPSAKAAWDSLKDVYVQKSAGSLIALMRQLYRTVMMPGSLVRAHLGSLNECFQQLEQRERYFGEEDKVLLILSSLSEDYNVLVTSLETVDIEKLSLEYVTGRLIEQERRLESLGSKPTSGKVARSGKVADLSGGGSSSSHCITDREDVAEGEQRESFPLVAFKVENMLFVWVAFTFEEKLSFFSRKGSWQAVFGWSSEESDDSAGADGGEQFFKCLAG